MLRDRASGDRPRLLDLFCGAGGCSVGYHQPVKALLEEAGLPYVIENVEGSPLRRDVVLCGEMFGLRVHRHRVFETSGFFVMAPRHQPHRLQGAKHNCHIEEGHARLVAGNYANHEDAADAMGIDLAHVSARAGERDPSGLHGVHRVAAHRSDQTGGRGMSDFLPEAMEEFAPECSRCHRRLRPFRLGDHGQHLCAVCISEIEKRSTEGTNV